MVRSTMSFEKEFKELSKELYNHAITIKPNPYYNGGRFISEIQIQEHCISISKLRKAWEKCRKTVEEIYEAEYGAIGNCPELDKFEEELGLK